MASSSKQYLKSSLAMSFANMGDLTASEASTVFEEYKEKKLQEEQVVTESVEGVFPSMKIDYPHALATQEVVEACALVKKSLILRNKYMGQIDTNHVGGHHYDVRPDYDNLSADTYKELDTKYSCEFVDGVLRFKNSKGDLMKDCLVHSAEDFQKDYAVILSVASSGPVRTFSYERLEVMESKFEAHEILNRHREVDS
eukprot:CAMPEP_0201515136 /NCGR_PEP_ID=MMETSP0161_2-20130828/6791_1 /ASSEMBLY_ACC=CAM_ASM_000251 /TAXON_ID=180227 /ORGANISM="Neoparamoeba aestuarina, Strain SoJaBio B1-5/56/2" /LENGTH=197 /DNA_ID=CAMNT_0047911879 /DNA_START=81 /DNA_END=671 /DNA_ORIENTATION=-